MAVPAVVCSSLRMKTLASVSSPISVAGIWTWIAVTAGSISNAINMSLIVSRSLQNWRVMLTGYPTPAPTGSWLRANHCLTGILY